MNSRRFNLVTNTRNGISFEFQDWWSVKLAICKLSTLSSMDFELRLKIVLLDVADQRTDMSGVVIYKLSDVSVSCAKDVASNPRIGCIMYFLD